jgi:hypothetical protein
VRQSLGALASSALHNNHFVVFDLHVLCVTGLSLSLTVMIKQKPPPGVFSAFMAEHALPSGGTIFI